jgi:hypothetical protein
MIPKPLGSFARWFMVISVCGAIGAVANVILFFLAAFLFAGTNGDSWVRWYFGSEGIYFVAVTVLLALLAFPFVKRFRYRLV